MAMEPYPDEITVALVGAAAKVLGMPPSDCAKGLWPVVEAESKPMKT